MKKLVHLLIGDPKKLFTPFNLISGLIVVVGLGLIGLRLLKGLGAVTNLSQTTPWGLWIGFDVMSGVALAAGGYTIAATVHLFGLKEYEPLVRPAILTGFLGYVFVVLGLILDLGQPWRMPLIMIFPRGVTSVLFEVGMCVAAYLTVQALEFVPAFWEWLRMGQGQAVLEPADDMVGDPGSCAQHSASIRPRLTFPDSADKTAPAVVFDLPAALFLHLEHYRRTFDGDR